MSNPATKGCHNCRRRRLRCDRSVPTCLKCSTNGEECLGYGTLLRWTNAPAIKGKLAGQLRMKPPKPSQSSSQSSSQSISAVETQEETIEDPSDQLILLDMKSELQTDSPSPKTACTILPGLLDPILDHLNANSRSYIHHSVSNAVCKDLVSLDQDTRNPFRSMIPLIQEFEYLQNIVIATSAMHLATAFRYQNRPARQELVDALAAKGKAIRQLRDAIENATPTNQTAVLAAIVFFVNLDLIDSGKGIWEDHVKAAETLISSLHRQARRKLSRQDSGLAPLADAIAADCLTYRILGSTTSGDTVPGFGGNKIDVLSILKRAQAHSYHCSPPEIMYMILLANQECAKTREAEPTIRRRLGLLLDQARDFDVHAWVHGIEGLHPEDDLDARERIASAHRAAARLYISLIMPEDDDSPECPRPNYDGFVKEILDHLSSVPFDHMLLKGAVWPTFMAGAQTDDPARRESCRERLGAAYTQYPHTCPWGYVRTAIEMLNMIWANKEMEGGEGGKGNWLLKLRNSGGRALII
ncbi:fungal-specific transcription factor domain-containing protein [Immersiella caudata]|uniref:Fungal-specific transcription factor domain-containing protein n=1 Tax=Immersiella caudata TaxID=314043 RepID=A0AA39WYD8_9PEZI|nr:fungal-specific transcription factor domain-containing protein [Immersiella caudata]